MEDAPLYPIRFAPLFKSYIWGGRRLETVLNKNLGPGSHFAESWEVVDHGEDQSIVKTGAFRGESLSNLVAKHGRNLLGHDLANTKFPLLFKFLDANRNLSVQVHPNDQQAAESTPPDLGKTEAWYIVQADPGSTVYAGLKHGITPNALRAAVDNGFTADCLHQIQPKTGDCLFIPAGTVHALGNGLLVAEIQQSSNTTFRLFDWNRTDSQGNARELHIDQAMSVIDFDAGPVHLQSPEPTEHDQAMRLVDCDKFVLDRWQLSKSHSLPLRNSFHILSVVSGSLSVDQDPDPLRAGDTILIPAVLEGLTLTPTPEAIVLDMFLP